MKMLLTLMVCCSCYNLFSQPLIISGFVKDEYGNPIPRATLSPVKNKNYVITANKDGFFIINKWENNDSIICSHVNYKSKAEKIEGNNTLNFYLDRATPVLTAIKINIKRDSVNRYKKGVNIEKDYIEDYATRVEIPSRLIQKQKNEFEIYINNSVKKLIQTDTLKYIGGTIKAGVTISKNGVAVNIRLIKGIHKVFDEMVVNAVREILKWAPAEQNGTKVESYQEVSVSL